jgi:hypothetical protein
MASPFQQLAQEDYSNNPESGKKNPYLSPFEEYSNSPEVKAENEEGAGMTAARYATQIPQGWAATTVPGIAAGLWHAMAVGEAFDPEDLERIEEIAKREGVPFDKEKYLQEAQNAVDYVPSVSNIGRGVEKRTGIPLEPKTRGQKALRFATEATRLSPEGATLRPLDVALPKPVLGAGVEGAREILLELGVPEPIADIASFAILKQPSEGAAQFKVGSKTKPSGIPERRFEDIKQETKISPERLEIINKKVKHDFTNVLDKIIKDSPIGETANELANNPKYLQETRELFEEVQARADSLPGTYSTKLIHDEMDALARQNFKGAKKSEYDIEYENYINKAKKDYVLEEMTEGQTVQQYRKNNAELTEIYEPGSSAGKNRAKRDALLDENRALANVMERRNRDPEMVKAFKENNARWTKIKDTEAVDELITDIFSGPKISHKKIHDFFDKKGYDRIFKRALGDEGYNKFVQLMDDMLTTERPYKMLRVAEKKGYWDMSKNFMAYLVHPHLLTGKVAIEGVGKAYRGIMNAMLDKPKVGFSFMEAIQDLKKGNFTAAEEKIKFVKTTLEEPPKTQAKAPKGETIEVAPMAPEKTPEVLEAPKKRIEHKEPKSESPPPKKKPLPKKDAQKKFKEKLSEKSKKQIKDEAIKEANKADRPDISVKTAKNQKHYMLNKIEDVLSNPSAFKNQEKIIFDVPGDGEFKIHNNEKALLQFKAQLEKSWPDKKLRDTDIRRMTKMPKYKPIPRKKS